MMYKLDDGSMLNSKHIVTVSLICESYRLTSEGSVEKDGMWCFSIKDVTGKVHIIARESKYVTDFEYRRVMEIIGK